MAKFTIGNVPPRLLADIEPWSKLRRFDVETAALELLKIGAEVTSEKNERFCGALETIELHKERTN